MPYPDYYKDLTPSLASSIEKMLKGLEDLHNKFSGIAKWMPIEPKEEDEGEYVGIDGSSSGISRRYVFFYAIRASAFPGEDSLFHANIIYPVRVKRARVRIKMGCLENLMAYFVLKYKGKDLLLDGLFSGGFYSRMMELRSHLKSLPSLADEAEIKDLISNSKKFWEKRIKFDGNRIFSDYAVLFYSDALGIEEMEPLVETIEKYQRDDLRYYHKIAMVDLLECLASYDLLLGEIFDKGAKAVYLAKSSFSSLIVGKLSRDKKWEDYGLTDYMLMDRISKGRPGFLKIYYDEIYKGLISPMTSVIDEESLDFFKTLFPNLYSFSKKMREAIERESLRRELDRYFSVSFVRFSPEGAIHKIEVMNGELERAIEELTKELGSLGYPFCLKMAHSRCKITRLEINNLEREVLESLERFSGINLEGFFSDYRKVLGGM